MVFLSGSSTYPYSREALQTLYVNVDMNNINKFVFIKQSISIAYATETVDKTSQSLSLFS